MNRLKDINAILNNALKKDIAIKLGDINNNHCTLIVYKLNDVYNDLYTLHFVGSYFTIGGYSITKTKKALSEKMLILIEEHIQTRGQHGINEIIKLVNAYEPLQKMVYDAKYNFNTLNDLSALL